MTDKPRFDPKLITFKGARLAFFRPEPAPRIGKDGKPRGKPKASATVLLDPTNKEHASVIALVKSESVRALNHRYPAEPGQPPRFNVEMLDRVARVEQVIPNFHLCWGLGNDLPKHGNKLYDGFADMFYVKLTDENAPNLLTGQTDDKGEPIVAVPGGKRYPYGGCIIAGTTTMYSYDNDSRGVNANLRTLVYQGEGKAFGGGGKADANSEFAALGDLGTGAAESLSDPFGAAGNGPVVDPFAIA